MKFLILVAVVLMSFSAKATSQNPPTNCKEAILNVHVKSIIAGEAIEKASANQKNAIAVGEFELARSLRHRNRAQGEAFSAYEFANQLCGVEN